jgi:hypothetical protein
MFLPLGASHPIVWRRALGLAAFCLLVGCEADPVGNHLFGWGDPVRGAALHAPRTLGDTSRWAGQPAQAAMAAAQLEFLAAELPGSPRHGPGLNPGVEHQLGLARNEMRGFLGIAADARPDRVVAQLRAAAEALRRGSSTEAEAALTAPEFAAGPLVTLARLAAMPRLPQTSIAASQAAAELARLDRCI